MKKVLNLIAWISAGLGILMMILGVTSGAFLGHSIIPAIDHMSTYFHIANSQFLITIVLFLFLLREEYKMK